MGLRLSVQRTAWQHSVESAAIARPGLVPVVKGNGYGFGRRTLMPIAARLSTGHTRVEIAVGTVYEVGDVPEGCVPVVLTPHVDVLPAGVPADAVLTVGSVHHVRSLQQPSREQRGWAGRVSIKLASTMHRYGSSVEELPALIAAATDAGFTIVGFSIHLPLSGTDDGRAGEIGRWLPLIEPALPVSVSHLTPQTYASLRTKHADRDFRIRCGTALWHADKRLVHLTADVLDVHPVAAGSTAGYHSSPVPGDGHIVLVAAGSTHGVRALDNGLSPFHFARQRIPLIEQPHMHTSMLFVPVGQAMPVVGDRVDVQRPLIETTIDELEWLDD